MGPAARLTRQELPDENLFKEAPEAHGYEFQSGGVVAPRPQTATAGLAGGGDLGLGLSACGGPGAPSVLKYPATCLVVRSTVVQLLPRAPDRDAGPSFAEFWRPADGRAPLGHQAAWGSRRGGGGIPRGGTRVPA